MEERCFIIKHDCGSIQIIKANKFINTWEKLTRGHTTLNLPCCSNCNKQIENDLTADFVKFLQGYASLIKKLKKLGFTIKEVTGNIKLEETEIKLD